MTERISGFGPKDLREVAREILGKSTTVLTVNWHETDGILTDELRKLNETPDTVGAEFSDGNLTPEDELGLNLFFNVVNFCYQNPVTKESYKYKSVEGNDVMRSTGLKKALAESGISWGVNSMVAAITPDLWSKVTQLDQNPDFYLGHERGTRISMFANKLDTMGFNSTLDLLRATRFSTTPLLAFLNDTPFFRDEFQKRSQLTVNMLDGVLGRRFGTRLKGTEKLTVMADYRLPQLMYNTGAIRLSQNLNRKLREGTVLATGSTEEVALRAASIVIGKKLSENLNLPEGKIDSLLWTLAVTLSRENKLLIPHMLVATDKY